MKGVAAKTRNKYQAAFEMIAPLALLYLQFISSRIRNVIPGLLTAIGESHQTRLKDPSSDRAPDASFGCFNLACATVSIREFGADRLSTSQRAFCNQHKGQSTDRMKDSPGLH